MRIIDRIDAVRQAALTGGLALVERVLGNAEYLGAQLVARPPKVDPVVLVGGWATGDRSWEAWTRSLARDGVPTFTVTVPGNAIGDLDDGARYLAAQVERIRRDTGARHVDLVGFSAGGLIVRQYAKFHAVRDAVDAVVTLATPNGGLGSSSAIGNQLAQFFAPAERVLMGVSSVQMRPGSAFMRRLNDARIPDAAGPGVRYASVYSAIFDGATTAAGARLDRGLNLPIGHEPNIVKLPMGPDHYMIMHRSSGAYEAARGVLLARGG